MNNRNPKLFQWEKDKHIKLLNYPIFKKIYKYDKSDIKNLNNVNLFVKNSQGESYIPGSSIKGAIRTAVLSQMLKENLDLRQKYQNEIIKVAQLAHNKKEFNNAFKKIISKIEQDLLSIPSKNRDQKKEVLDVFRGIQVSDSQNISNNNFGLYKKIDFPLDSEKLNKLSLYRECINSYVHTEFNITLDTNIVKQKGIDINYIMQACNNFTQDWHELLVAFERDLDKFRIYMPKDEETFNANFCIGGGAGFLTKTIIYSIFDDKNVAVKVVKKYLDVAFRTHYHATRDKSISPRTLKLAQEGKAYVNLGWCNISEVKERV
jgi:CRISPR-associated protein Csm5